MNNIPSFYKSLCEKCGKEIEKKSAKHNLCNNCWKDNKNQMKSMQCNAKNSKLNTH